jgi:hypothetical protein
MMGAERRVLHQAALALTIDDREIDAFSVGAMAESLRADAERLRIDVNNARSALVPVARHDGHDTTRRLTEMSAALNNALATGYSNAAVAAANAITLRRTGERPLSFQGAEVCSAMSYMPGTPLW